MALQSEAQRLVCTAEMGHAHLSSMQTSTNELGMPDSL